MVKLTREQVIEKLDKGDKDFKGLDLSRLNLCGLYLSNCDFTHANLSSANLENSNLFYANLFFTDLSYTNLRGADLTHALFANADLSYADLSESDLSYANLFCSELSKAELYNANLDNVNLDGSKLDNAKLDEKEQIRKGIILKESMIGYKKCTDNIIVTLEIPKGAIVFSINNKQCRTNKAKVIDISKGKTVAVSKYNKDFIYRLGQEIEIEDFDLAYNVECASGIHFFRTREDAEDFQ